MSRYLEYCAPDATNAFSTVSRLRDPPRRRYPVFLVGPEDEFREYLTQKQYKGGSRIFCGGRFAVGQVWPNAISTFVATFVPGAVYFEELLPQVLRAPVLGTALGRSQAVLAVVILVCFFLAAFVNPGIIPRSPSMPPEARRHADINHVPFARFLRIHGISVKQKFCMTCYVFRPPRSKHCSVCDNCVLRFDHHCTWLGNCVGLHNYRFFVCLIYTATAFLIQCIYTAFSILDARAAEEYGAEAGFMHWLVTVSEDPKLVVFLVYCIILLFCTLLLSIYHTVIIMQNLTTNEHVNTYYRDGANPFNFGPLKNFWHVCCHPERVVAEGADYLGAEYDSHPSASDLGSYDELDVHAQHSGGPQLR